jgi:hypothetical protein
MESSYKASITREQFLFYEMKTTARLLAERQQIRHGKRKRRSHSAPAAEENQTDLPQLQFPDQTAAE